ncbi:hypothetical protein HYH02_007708 [Chlamydomonas schloesseri]|uniref:Glycosyltransferase (GlcNAc) n=1 Tax=Chlamydomonas schloesseri TaxID=2026947 RepID=A0A836B4H8_9CHLO|nr:hypothetical protein HYH02_007708 [Chlamydomonas schloesseri]|eukprot:KAG2447380.1 hypothetical protein HYH02_007708 [Chlamydomonas schloesseri]
MRAPKLTAGAAAEARALAQISRTDRQFLSAFLFIIACTALFLWIHHNSVETIFVSVASYRDAECVDTLVDLYRKAARPENVFVGVVTFTNPDQATSSSERCEAPQLAPYEQNIRRINMNHTLSRGLSMARHHAAKLYRMQKYLLQIDAHMTFAAGWDAELLRMVKAVPSKKPLITTYPASDEDTTSTDVPVTCRASWMRGPGAEQGVLRFAAALEPAPAPGEFLPVPFAAGAFMFGPAAVLHEVPYDPGLSYLFHGEEELYSARLWTSGWDFYTPDMNVLYHNYARGGSHSASTRYGNKYWSDLASRPEYRDSRQESLRKVADLMSGRYTAADGAAYGMGAARPLGDWWAYAGLDPADTSTGADGSKFCKSLRYGTAGVKLLSGEDEPQQAGSGEGSALEWPAEEGAEQGASGSAAKGHHAHGRASATGSHGVHRAHKGHGAKRRGTGRGGGRGGGGGGGASEQELARGRQAVAGAQAVYDRQRAAAGGARGP